ncbi:ferric-dicitrate binding protein FerR (iron transport regulator) [Xanthomonas arboricola]|uniref:FecR domain-containing protein n=1 Tax=Xanthomonas arboricola TaxID=56448 RepID=UPI00160BA126|nr:ferric-dicitrate binding protein FerR (iron transport regulator) [Xanthomonas arboricola]
MHPDDTKAQTPLDPCVLEQAAEWVVRLGEHGGAQGQAACERWQQQHPDNARAWRRVEELLGTINAVPPAIARPVLGRPKHPGRRLAMKHLGAWLLAAPAGWLAWQLWEQSNWDQRFRTGTGEWHHQQLADGTQIELDSGTSLDVAYGAKQRLLRLQQGQVLITTAPDSMPSPRPFRVATTHGYMQALGTRFNVRVGHTLQCARWRA